MAGAATATALTAAEGAVTAAGAAAMLPATAASIGTTVVASAATSPTGSPAGAAVPSSPIANAVPGTQATEFEIDGVRYVGEFVMDADGKTWSGKGILTYKDGQVFDGNLVRGERQGFGTLFWRSGKRYSGDWMDDKPRGFATIDYGTVAAADASGPKYYRGRVHDGEPHGVGTMEYRNGERYSGEFKRGERDGLGTYIYLDPPGRYEGGWLAGKKHGRAIVQSANGQRSEVTYEHDELKQPGK